MLETETLFFLFLLICFAADAGALIPLMDTLRFGSRSIGWLPRE